MATPRPPKKSIRRHLMADKLPAMLQIEVRRLASDYHGYDLLRINHYEHERACEESPVYPTVRAWLAVQPPQVIAGCNPVLILRGIVEVLATSEEGSIEDLENLQENFR